MTGIAAETLPIWECRGNPQIKIKGELYMNNYIFKTTTTMKEYNNKKWWINSDIVPEIRIKAETLKEALYR